MREREREREREEGAGTVEERERGERRRRRAVGRKRNTAHTVYRLSWPGGKAPTVRARVRGSLLVTASGVKAVVKE